MSFSVHESCIILCNNEQLIIYNSDSDTENTIILPDLQSSKKIDVHNNVDIETYHSITSVMFSSNGRYFAVCTNRKQLCLYESKVSPKLLSNRTLVRAASKVRFSPNDDIIVADKAGDVYLFSTSTPTEAGILILGHMSMLLDVLITHDMRYILTTDRDEKIRVSMFPNCYNIMSYCLGHEKFVTNISELPHNKSILLSCGGDGILYLWDYEFGTELKSVNFCDQISKHDVDKFNQDLRDYHYDESVNILPVKHLRVSRLSKVESLIVISFYSSKILLTYLITSNEDTRLPIVNYLESIILEAEPVECFLYKQDLWVLTDIGMQIYKFENEKFVTHVSNHKTERLNKFWEILKSTATKQNLFPILYKRKYDNVQEYLERKKIRLANTG